MRDVHTLAVLSFCVAIGLLTGSAEATSAHIDGDGTLRVFNGEVSIVCADPFSEDAHEYVGQLHQAGGESQWTLAVVRDVSDPPLPVLVESRWPEDDVQSGELEVVGHARCPVGACARPYGRETTCTVVVTENSGAADE
jgi:hypothetical protein